MILPGVNNLPVVRWACTDIQRQVLEHGCNIWLSPPPFDHSKLLIVDSFWVLFGSGNWDSRSFQLNFEFNVECYDQNLAAQLDEIINSKLKHAHLVSIEEIDSRRLPVKLRDGIARLFSPYL
ncbi:MAG TPA: hypothetical protein ENG80_00550 [Nitrospirae bacterium]|nr:hypothetical protein [Nitrospirota bacterium]